MTTGPYGTAAQHSAQLVVRVDADDRIGLGHLVRSFAVAQTWRRSIGNVRFVCASLPAEWRRRLTDAGMTVFGEDELRGLANSRSVLLLDSYDVDASSLSDGFGAFAAVDDFGVGRRGSHADLVIDQSALPDSPVPDTYRRARRLLRGPRYAMLRDQFEDPPPRVPISGRLLVSLGGRPTIRTMRWSDEVIRNLDGDMEVVRLSGVDDVASLLSSCEMALAAAGSTTWELCRLGVPTAFAAVAENQLGVLDTVARAGAGISLGSLRSLDPREAAATIRALRADGERQERMSERASALVDGQGSRRVVTALRSALLRARPARRGDNAVFRVVEDDGRPIGQLRIDVRDDVGHVEVSVSTGVPERGLAASVIEVGTRAVFARLPHVQRLQAKVLDGEEALGHSFIAADYDIEPAPPEAGHPWRTFVRCRTDRPSRPQGP